MRIDLPESSTADQQQVQGVLFVITPAATVLVNDAENPLEDLAAGWKGFMPPPRVSLCRS